MAKKLILKITTTYKNSFPASWPICILYIFASTLQQDDKTQKYVTYAKKISGSLIYQMEP